MKQFLLLTFAVFIFFSQNVISAPVTFDLFDSDVTAVSGTQLADDTTIYTDTTNGNPEYWLLNDLSASNNVLFSLSPDTQSYELEIWDITNNVQIYDSAVTNANNPLSFYLFSGVTYWFALQTDPLFGGQAFSLTISTPIPAAIWLFGSALLGLIGISRRKSRSILAV